MADVKDAAALMESAWTRRRLSISAAKDEQEALIDEAPDLRAYVPVRDATAVSELWDQPEGSQVEAAVGGRLHPEMNPSVSVRGTLLAKRQTEHFGRAVTLDGDTAAIGANSSGRFMK